jgi:hypothetical protein
MIIKITIVVYVPCKKKDNIIKMIQ